VPNVHSSCRRVFAVKPANWKLESGRVVLDAVSRRVWLHGEPVQLGGRAFDVLCLLLSHAGQVMSKQALLDHAWAGRVVQENNLHVQIKALRRVLGHQIVCTVPGRGYQLGCQAEPLAEVPVPLASATSGGGLALFGRADLSRAACAALLTERVRLLTFTGVAGVGKTCLARQVLEQARQQPSARVVAVFLAPLQDCSLMMPALADAMGIRAEGGNSPAQAVIAWLRQRPCLLLLDNLEHLLPQASQQIANLLEQCPRIQILATSRMRLRVAGEREVKVAPLALPDGDSREQMLASPAVQLFMARALNIGHAVDHLPDSLAAAAQVCRGLDGLPLAIELAVARLRVLSPLALAQRLLPRLPLLKVADGPMPARHRTLQGAIAWSYELLAPEAQLLFARLGVCAGGFSLALAEALCNRPGAALDGLEQLLDQNLLHRLNDVLGQPRYGMLETIREFALERLTQSRDESDVRRRHGGFLADMVLAHDRLLRSGQRAEALEQLRADRNNLRAALHWALHTRDGETAGRLATGAAWWWYFDDAATEGLAWASKCLALPPSPAWLAGTLLAVARTAVLCAQVQTAQDCANRAADLAREAGDVDTHAQALQMLAFTLMGSAPRQACEVLERCIALFESIPSEWDAALATGIKGMALAWHPGSEVQALAALMASRARFRALNDAWCLTPVTHHLAIVNARLGQPEVARQFAHETLASATNVGYGFMAAGAKHMLARLSLAEGDLTQACQWTRQSIAASWALGHWRDALLHCRWLGHLLLKSESEPRLNALALFAVGAAELDDQVVLAATVMTPQEQAEWEGALADLKALLPADEWSAAWQAAAAIPPEQTLRAFGVL
jgi:predicted ATPase